MEKNKIKKALDFYVFANQLKSIRRMKTSQSYADFLYGSLILAISLDSEFEITNDLGKVLRMIVLEDIAVADNPKNTFLEKLGNLSKGKKYLQEIKELRTLKTSEAKLAYEAKRKEYQLNRIMIENEQKNVEELYELVIQQRIFLPQNDEEYRKYKEIFRFYYLNQKLKSKERSAWDKKHWNIKNDRIESISEHVYGTIILAIALDSEFNFNIDIDKVIETLAIHEIGEILIGDITPFDKITPRRKEKMEHEAIIQVVGKLMKRRSLIKMIFSFDRKKTNEAKFAYWCDKLEADIQSKIYQEMGCHHSLDSQENNIVFQSEAVQKMIENGAKTAFDIWYEYDKPNFNESLEFQTILDYVKEHEIKKYYKKL